MLVFVALFAALWNSAFLAAQTNLGAVQGHVQDQQNKAITGASVTLRNPSTAYNKTTQTDSSGNYSFLGVPLTGSYVVTVTAPQFNQGEQKDILLRAGGTAVLDFTLAISSAKTEVERLRHDRYLAYRIKPGFHASGSAED